MTVFAPDKPIVTVGTCIDTESEGNELLARIDVHYTDKHGNGQHKHVTWPLNKNGEGEDITSDHILSAMDVLESVLENDGANVVDFWAACRKRHASLLSQLVAEYDPASTPQ